MVTLVVVDPVGGEVAFDNIALDVEAEAVAAIVADLSELGLEPSRGDEVVRQGSVVLQVLFFVVFDLFVEVLV